MEELTLKDRGLFVLFVIIPPVLYIWWTIHIDRVDSFLFPVVPILIALNGLIIWLINKE
jgi:hypothetical protein